MKLGLQEGGNKKFWNFCEGVVIIYESGTGANRGGINFSAGKLRWGANCSASLEWGCKICVGKVWR